MTHYLDENRQQQKIGSSHTSSDAPDNGLEGATGVCVKVCKSTTLFVIPVPTLTDSKRLLRFPNQNYDYRAILAITEIRAIALD